MPMDVGVIERESVATTVQQDQAMAADPGRPTTSVVSRLFATLISSVDRQRLVADRAYFALVSEIAELLSDDEVALLALYFAPPLAIGVPSQERRMALAIIRQRRKGKLHA